MVEGLEPRRLLAVTTQSFPLASATTQINGATTYPDGNIWYSATNPAELIVLHPPTNFVVEYPLNIPNSAPGAIAVGHDGDLYFVDTGTNSIGVFSPATQGKFEVPIPTAGADPDSIAVANDGTIWFTESAVGQIGEYNPATQKITEYPLQTTTSDPADIQLGPDGNLWFEENVGSPAHEDNGGSFDSINPTTHALTSIPSPAATPLIGGFAFTSDGSIWFVAVAEFHGAGGSYAAAKLDPATQQFTIYPSSATFYDPSGAYSPGGPFPAPLAVAGADGNVYFIYAASGPSFQPYPASLGEINTTTQQIVESGPTVDANVVTPGLDGNLYLGSTGDVARATFIPADQSVVQGSVTDPTMLYGVASVTVFVDLKGDGRDDPGDPSAVTEANGTYTIPGVPVGTFNVRLAAYPGDITSPVSITTTGGQYTPNLNLTVQPTSVILPLTYLANPFGSDNPDVSTAEVVGLYNIILGRAPDPSGLAFYVDYLKGGGSLQTVAATMLNSTEYKTDVVSSYYMNYLGRTGSPAEIAGWVAAMKGGETEEQVTAKFLSSGEFNADHPDTPSFIQAVYGDILGRAASVAEVDGWEGFLAGGGSRASIVSQVIASPESSTRVGEGFYAEFWGGTGPEDVSNVVTALADGMTMAQVAALFGSWPQFIARANASVG